MNFIQKIAAFSALVFCLFSCGKEVSIGKGNPEAYAFASTDDNGGTWKTVILASPTAISVPAPAAATDAAFLAEVAETKAAASNLTDEQKAAVEYWGANAVARWDEIAAELAAKYNLPPAFDPVLGKYPVPDATKPDQYPLFPFANPPYASRAFAHHSVGMFDALIACWSAKKAGARLAPYKYDSAIEPFFVVKNDLPSYPSEDATVAALSREVLGWLFPNEKAFLAAKAEEAKNARIWAGVNVKSDIAAGDSLGRKVAAQVIARGKTDKMGVANNQTVIDSTRAATEARGEMAWKSLESPARPPMLPTFGNVKPWAIPSAAALRPAAPPSTKSAEFEAEMQELRDFQGNLTAEQRRIANFWGDGPSTYTPPGHWNRIAADLCVAAKMNPLRTARTLAYLNMAIADAGIVCWHTKYFYFNPRPATFDPTFKSIMGVPNFPAYISGHSTFSAAGAAVLSHIFPAEAGNMERLAEEASNSRLYGGIHYRSDCKIGLATGKAVAVFSVEKAKADGGE